MSETAVSLHIRPATTADQDRLIPLINDAFGRAETFMTGPRIDPIRMAEAMKKGTILMAEDDRGALVASIYVELRGEGHGYIGMLAVDPARQGGGIGRRMMESCGRSPTRAGMHVCRYPCPEPAAGAPADLSAHGLCRNGNRAVRVSAPHCGRTGMSLHRDVEIAVNQGCPSKSVSNIFVSHLRAGPSCRVARTGARMGHGGKERRYQLVPL